MDENKLFMLTLHGERVMYGPFSRHTPDLCGSINNTFWKLFTEHSSLNVIFVASFNDAVLIRL